MKVVTSEYTLEVEDGRFRLRQHTSHHKNEEIWLNGRQGDLARSTIKVVAHTHRCANLYFDGRDLGEIDPEDHASLDDLSEIVSYYNTHIGPTDLLTAKTAAILSKGRDLVNTRHKLSVWTVTWNVFGSLSAFDPEQVEDLADYSNDIVVLNFQETDPLNRNLVANQQTLQTTIDKFSRPSHFLASSVQLLGLMTLVFVRNGLSVRNLENASSGTGFLRMWGNKGAVLTRFDVLSDELLGGGAEFAVVNCHLSAGENPEQNQRRLWELREISAKFRVGGVIDNMTGPLETDAYEYDADITSDEEVPARYRRGEVEGDPEGEGSHKGEVFIDSEDEEEVATLEGAPTPPAKSPHDKPMPELPGKPLPQLPAAATLQSAGLPKITVLAGDLNYRVHMSMPEVLELARNGNYQTILERDYCTILRNNRKLLVDFYEHPISFSPTYKYKLRSHAYDDSLRTPSYTDRIFYKSDLALKVNKYTSVSMTLSDHRPVISQAEIDVQMVDTAAYNKLVDGAFRMVDRAENLTIPSIKVEPHAIEQDATIFSVCCASVTISSESNRPVNWKLAPNPRIQCSPDEGVLQPRSSQRLILKSFAGVNTREINEILILNVEGGADRFVSVIFRMLPSIVGKRLEDLGEGHESVPKQISACVEYLWSRAIPEMFVSEGELSIIAQVVDWLEHGELDAEVLDTANKGTRGTGTLSVARALYLLLTNMPEPIIPLSFVGPQGAQLDALDQLAAPRASVALYLVGFFKHIFEFGCSRTTLLEPIERMLMGRSTEPEFEGARKEFVRELLK